LLSALMLTSCRKLWQPLVGGAARLRISMQLAGYA
jgi:hypothetical protein